jgi:hypothetical protein
MSKFYTYDAWVETFKPIKNHLVKYDSLTFETFDAEADFVDEQDPKHVWTEVDGDCGTYIVAGHHWVNRIHYYITENPWEDDYTEVPTWCYRQCDCTEDERFMDNEGYDPDCPECEEGTIDIPCDTVEDLKNIYGEENPDIVG